MPASICFWECSHTQNSCLIWEDFLCFRRFVGAETHQQCGSLFGLVCFKLRRFVQTWWVGKTAGVMVMRVLWSHPWAVWWLFECSLAHALNSPSMQKVRRLCSSDLLLSNSTSSYVTQPRKPGSRLSKWAYTDFIHIPFIICNELDVQLVKSKFLFVYSSIL